ncbi:MAG: hypothetical protein LUE25_03145 [Clostridiales bacterium]|nr:hypothetical protein [Clostridiales bacterium]
MKFSERSKGQQIAFVAFVSAVCCILALAAVYCAAVSGSYDSFASYMFLMISLIAVPAILVLYIIYHMASAIFESRWGYRKFRIAFASCELLTVILAGILIPAKMSNSLPYYMLGFAVLLRIAEIFAACGVDAREAGISYGCALREKLRNPVLIMRAAVALMLAVGAVFCFAGLFGGGFTTFSFGHLTIGSIYIDLDDVVLPTYCAVILALFAASCLVRHLPRLKAKE